METIFLLHTGSGGFQGGSAVKNPPASAGNVASIRGSRRSPGGGNRPTPVFSPAKSHEQRRLAGYSPWGLKESDMTQPPNNNNMGISLNIRNIRVIKVKNTTTQKNFSKGKLKVDLCNMRVSRVINVEENLSRAFSGTARLVLQNCLWISVILAQTALMKQTLAQKITNQNLFTGQRHSQRLQNVAGTSHNDLDPEYFPANR